MSLSLGPVLLFAKSLEATETFYRRLLGKDPKLKTSEVLIFDVEGHELVFIPDREPFQGNLAGLETEVIRGKGIILHLTAPDVDKEYRRLKKSGFDISSAPSDKPFGRRQMYIYDCNGYNIAIETVTPVTKNRA
ncbi:VOC family protein [Rhizobium leguminosarum]|uniref:VOC family protein n=1 Tax=Rhizobium leguminosarum TaxID=384 RepID=UPI0010319380|nr:VOC family protein [Rhizobium leguminosarum]TBG66108.1 VOC family protein [Rhizobium leguminosarum]